MNKLPLIVSFVILFVNPTFCQYSILPQDQNDSCRTSYMVDKNQTKVEVIDEVQQALNCYKWYNLGGNVLISAVNNRLFWYNISSKEIFYLYEFYDDLNIIGGVNWSDDHKKILFVIANPDKKHDFTEMCRIVVITTDGRGVIKSKKEFDKPVNHICSLDYCLSLSGSDFKFVNNNTIAYKRLITLKDRPGEWETIKLK